MEEEESGGGFGRTGGLGGRDVKEAVRPHTLATSIVRHLHLYRMKCPRFGPHNSLLVYTCQVECRPTRPSSTILVSPAKLNTIILILHIVRLGNNSATTYCRCTPESLLLRLPSTGSG